MKSVREICPPEENGEFSRYGCGYDDLLSSFGYETLLQVDDKDCQGDSWVLFRDGDRFGHLQFGWGSCSGCDALQACDSYQDLDELQQSLFRDIRWDTAEGLLDWFRTHDWAGDYSGRRPEQVEYVDRAKWLLAVMSDRTARTLYEELKAGDQSVSGILEYRLKELGVQ